MRSGNGQRSSELYQNISAARSAASLHERTTKTIAILSSRIAWPAVGRQTPPPQSFEQMPYSDHSSTTQSIGHGCMLHAYMCGPCAGNYSFSQMRRPNQAIGRSDSRDVRCSPLVFLHPLSHFLPIRSQILAQIRMRKSAQKHEQRSKEIVRFIWSETRQVRLIFRQTNDTTTTESDR